MDPAAVFVAVGLKEFTAPAAALESRAEKKKKKTA